MQRKILAIVMILGGGMLAWMAIAASTAPVDQLRDPFVGYLADYAPWYVAVASAVLVIGVVLFVAGGSKKRRVHAATDVEQLAHRVESR
jgi:hypothetical protein